MKKKLENQSSYRHKRYFVFVLFTVVALAIPFANIDGDHLVLLNFDKFQFHIFFTKFDMQELYLFPFLIMLVFVGLFFMTALGGRVWCGWLCPHTIFRIIYRDLIQTKLLKIRKKISNKQQEPSGQYLKRFTAVSIWTLLSLLASINFMWYFVPPHDFFAYMANPSQHLLIVGIIASLTIFLVYDIVKLQENYCIYVCPYARIQSIMYDDETIQTVYDKQRGGEIYKDSKKIYKNKKELLVTTPSADCVLCDACVVVCPTHIDIKKGMQLECINCLECADACTKVQGALGRESLITWTNEHAIKEKRIPHYFRARILVYIAVLAGLLSLLLYMGSTKEYMLLNINRTTQLYKIKENNIVENTYTMLFQNTDNVEHRYYFKVLNQDNIVIKRPTEAFMIKAGKKIKKIVILKTDNILVKDDSKDTAIPIKIEAYAKDDKENIRVIRDTTFVFPRYDKLK